MKETTTTKSYDFTEANDFLRYETQTTPEGLLEEVRGAMCQVQDLEYTRGDNEASQNIFAVLLTCADFLERLCGKEVAV